LQLTDKNTILFHPPKQGYPQDELGLYVEQLSKAILAKPFLSENYDRLTLKLFKKAAELGIKELNTVTVGNEDVREQNGITIEAVPFWQWALSL
jgi:predicted AAA+ superfamily ATPase